MWQRAPLEARRKVYQAYYEQDEKFMTTLFLKPIKAGVDLDGIFAGGADQLDRKKWRTYLKTIFCWLCEDTFALRVKVLDAKLYNITPPLIAEMKLPEQLVSNLKQMAFRPELKPLNLGDVDDVPIPAADISEQQRRQPLLPAIIEGGTRVLIE